MELVTSISMISFFIGTFLTFSPSKTRSTSQVICEPLVQVQLTSSAQVQGTFECKLLQVDLLSHEASPSWESPEEWEVHRQGARSPLSSFVHSEQQVNEDKGTLWHSTWLWRRPVPLLSPLWLVAYNFTWITGDFLSLAISLDNFEQQLEQLEFEVWVLLVISLVEEFVLDKWEVELDILDNPLLSSVPEKQRDPSFSGSTISGFSVSIIRSCLGTFGRAAGFNGWVLWSAESIPESVPAELSSSFEPETEDPPDEDWKSRQSRLEAASTHESEEERGRGNGRRFRIASRRLFPRPAT